MNSISPAALLDKLSEGEDIQLIDVREPWEHDAFNIGGELYPLDQILCHLPEISETKPVVFYCQKGIRSVIAIQKILQKKNFSNLYNLEGGMQAWKKQVGE